MFVLLLTTLAVVALRRLLLAVVIPVKPFGRTTIAAKLLLSGKRQRQREMTNGAITIDKVISHSRVPMHLVIVVGVLAGVPNGTRIRNGNATVGLLVIALRRLRLTICCPRASLL